MSEKQEGGGGFRFRVSDVYDVPRRGTMLRLKLVDGEASAKAFRPGARFWLAAPEGEGRSVTIRDLGVTGGRSTQHRLERTGELDVLVSPRDAWENGPPVRIGWHALPERDARST